jgi:hypothetical protein
MQTIEYKVGRPRSAGVPQVHILQLCEVSEQVTYAAVRNLLAVPNGKEPQRRVGGDQRLQSRINNAAGLRAGCV